MILDAISNGDFRPEQMGFMDDEKYQDAMQEICRCRATLMENIDKGDSLFLDELLDEAKHAESAACSRSFQYGFAAGLVLMQEAQALVREQSVTEVCIKTK